jgi:hypothetical protein
MLLAGMQVFILRPLRLGKATSSYAQRCAYHMLRSRKFRTNPSSMPTEETIDYTNWSHENLIKRVTELENELKSNNARLVYPP